MKKKLLLALATLMCISLCACGGSDTTSGDSKEEGFTPTATTETEETDTKEETEKLSLDMTVEEMQQYYDTSKFVGTPRIETLKILSTDKDSNTATYKFLSDMTNTKYTMDYQEGLFESLWCRCIVVDNNTPDDTKDDVLAYVFLKWFD